MPNTSEENAPPQGGAAKPADMSLLPSGSGPSESGHGSHNGHAKVGFWSLVLGSMGVVYGDIGTSPLYAFREALAAAGEAHGGVQRSDVIGILSLILWTLMIIVTLKYVLILLRADNDGEGGTLSLMALAQRAIGKPTLVITSLGIFGAALFYGDALITPAISVLSAVEGLKLVTDRFEPYVVPLTIVILIVLFMVQSRGTAKVAVFFGPIMLVWFALMAFGGLNHIVDDLEVFTALNPVHAVRFLLSNGYAGLIALGAVFLSVTGAEALYADLGHFGRKPIQTAWIGLVFPALSLNYMGQAALVLKDPTKLENPFYLLFPEWMLLIVVIIATLATVIASQAVISGAYSLTRQAIQLKLVPRLHIRHTSETQAGQIYMPQVNYLILAGVLFLVLVFGSSSRLATAYGIAVTGTMIVDATLAFVVIWKRWDWPVWAAALLIAPFLMIDSIFFGANLLKLFEGGYIPLTMAALLITMIRIWVRGTKILFDKSRKDDIPMVDLARSLEKKPPHIVPGTAVFLTSDPQTTPASLLHSLKHYKVLHEKNVLLTVKTAPQPRVPQSERVKMEPIDDRFLRVSLSFGYMEEPNVPKALALCRKMGWKFDIMSTSFFVSRRNLKRAAKSEFSPWQDSIFIALANNASDATDYFHIPTGRVVEIGAQIAI